MSWIKVFLANKIALITFLYVYFFCLSLILCRISVYFLKKFSLRFHLHDEPGELKIPMFPRYLSGGLAIVFSLALTVVVNLGIFMAIVKSGYSDVLPEWVIKNYFLSIKVLPRLTAILAGAGLAAFVGFLDDLKRLWIGTKLVFQFIISFLVVYAGIEITFLDMPYFNEIITILWLMLITNAINLLDNMDGLAGSVSFVISLSLFFIAVSMQQYFVASISIALCGTLTGFLWRNFVPATISMGKSGAYFTGYLLGSITIIGTYYTRNMPTYYSVLTPFFLMLTPMFDTFSVIFIRWYQKRPIFQGDKNHLSHRLCQLGQSKTVSVSAILLLTCISSISAILLTCVTEFGAYIIFAQLLFVVAFFAVLMVPHKL